MARNEKIKSWLIFYGPFILALLIIVGWAVFFYFVSPTTVVDKIGIKNSYIIAFVIAVVCGFSSLTGTTFYVAVIALANGGADPLILGLVGGVGLCISDSAFYFVVHKGVPVIDTHWKKLSDFIRHWVQRMPSWVIYPFVFAYSAFAPIPNDIMLVTLAIGKTPFKKVAPFLFAGDIVATLVLTYLSH